MVIGWGSVRNTVVVPTGCWAFARGVVRATRAAIRLMRMREEKLEGPSPRTSAEDSARFSSGFNVVSRFEDCSVQRALSIHQLHVEPLTNDIHLAVIVLVVGGAHLQLVCGGVVDSKPAVLDHINYGASGGWLNAGHIAVLRRNHYARAIRIEDGQTAANLAPGDADIGATASTNEELPILAYLHAIMVPVGDGSRTRNGHRSGVDNTQLAAGSSRRGCSRTSVRSRRGGRRSSCHVQGGAVQQAIGGCTYLSGAHDCRGAHVEDANPCRGAPALRTAIQNVSSGVVAEDAPYRVVKAGDGTPGISVGPDEDRSNHSDRVGVIAKDQDVVTIRAGDNEVRARHRDGRGDGTGLQVEHLHRTRSLSSDRGSRDGGVGTGVGVADKHALGKTRQVDRRHWRTRSAVGGLRDGLSRVIDERDRVPRRAENHGELQVGRNCHKPGLRAVAGQRNEGRG